MDEDWATELDDGDPGWDEPEPDELVDEPSWDESPGATAGVELADELEMKPVAEDDPWETEAGSPPPPEQP